MGLKDVIKDNSLKGIAEAVADKALAAAKHFIPTEEGRQELELKRKELAQEAERIMNESLADARANETSRDVSANSGFLSKNIHEIIALIVVLSFVGLSIASMKFAVLPAAIVAVKEAVMMVLAYLYGRSKPEGIDKD